MVSPPWRVSEMHYCTTCGWLTVPNEEQEDDDCNEQAIQHYLETEHTVVHRSFDDQSTDLPISRGPRTGVSHRL